MKNAGTFIVDTLNRLKRSILVTGTSINFKGRKAITYPEFAGRFLKKTEYVKGSDPLGYYGVRLIYEVDGTKFIFDTSLKRAMVWETDKKTKEVSPYILEIHVPEMVSFLNCYHRSGYGDYLVERNGGRAVRWTDYTPKTV